MNLGVGLAVLFSAFMLSEDGVHGGEVKKENNPAWYWTTTGRPYTTDGPGPGPRFDHVRRLNNMEFQFEKLSRNVAKILQIIQHIPSITGVDEILKEVQQIPQIKKILTGAVIRFPSPEYGDENAVRYYVQGHVEILHNNEWGTICDHSFNDPGSCFEIGIDYYGHDIIGRAPRTSSAVECQSKCANTRGCSYFTWKTGSHHCWLKKSDQGRRKADDVVSGPARCAGVAGTGVQEYGTWRLTFTRAEFQRHFGNRLEIKLSRNGILQARLERIEYSLKEVACSNSNFSSHLGWRCFKPIDDYYEFVGYLRIQPDGKMEVHAFINTGYWDPNCQSSYHGMPKYCLGATGMKVEGSGDKNANVLCQMGGYKSGVYHGGRYKQRNAPKAQRIWLDQAYCRSGNETSIGNCDLHNGWGYNNCNHNEDVGIRCYI